MSLTGCAASACEIVQHHHHHHVHRHLNEKEEKEEDEEEGEEAKEYLKNVVTALIKAKIERSS